MNQPAPEETQHSVTISDDYYLGVYEVTQAEYQRVMGKNPSQFKEAQNPVEKISWDDAVEFCRKLSELPEEKAAGRVYRLPTEAEWEYACRARSTSPFGFGEAEIRLQQYAWYSDNSKNQTHPVGEKKPNGWGLYDMHGNVWEWCSDWHAEYSHREVTDPAGPTTGSFRVRRGGSWDSGASFCQSAFRYRGAPTYSSASSGFRVAIRASGTEVHTERPVSSHVRGSFAHPFFGVRGGEPQAFTGPLAPFRF